MRRITFALALLLTSLLDQGCASVGARSQKPVAGQPTTPRPRLYPGVQADARLMGAGSIMISQPTNFFDPILGVGFILLGLVDLPFSAGYDTWKLPKDLKH